MQIASIQPEQLEAFARLGDHPLGAPGLAGAVRKLWAEGKSRPEWCFIAEKDGQAVGRVGYTGSSVTPHELGLIGLWVDWQGDFLGVGVSLLRESLRVMRSFGWTYLERRLQSGEEFSVKERALLEKVGVPLAQEKASLSRKDTARIRIPDRLCFRSLAEVGEEGVIDALRRVSDGTLDRVDTIERSIMGHTEHARAYVTILRRVDDRPEWWQLAYTQNDDLVGLVIPQQFGEDLGAINYIGIVPEKRGHGYGADVLAKGTTILQAAGISEIIAEVDIHNAPMLAAFGRLGYLRQPGTQFVYLGKLDDVIRLTGQLQMRK